jgi:hypothetical protein
VPVKRRPRHSGDFHKVTDFPSLRARGVQCVPQRSTGGIAGFPYSVLIPVTGAAWMAFCDMSSSRRGIWECSSAVSVTIWSVTR